MLERAFEKTLSPLKHNLCSTLVTLPKMCSVVPAPSVSSIVRAVGVVSFFFTSLALPNAFFALVFWRPKKVFGHSGILTFMYPCSSHCNACTSSTDHARTNQRKLSSHTEPATSSARHNSGSDACECLPARDLREQNMSPACAEQAFGHSTSSSLP